MKMPDLTVDLSVLVELFRVIPLSATVYEI